MINRILLLLVLPLACVALLTAADPIVGQETVLQIDPAQTRIEFSVPSTLHLIHGAFVLKRGDIRFDAVTGNTSGELVVDAGTGDSGSAARDRRMRNSILETERYPEIVFRPDRMEGKVAVQGASQIKLHGTFSIHGTEHEMTIPVDVNAADGRYAATMKFTVPYITWGMKNPSTLFLRVSGSVDVTIHAIARPPQ